MLTPQEIYAELGVDPEKEPLTFMGIIGFLLGLVFTIITQLPKILRHGVDVLVDSHVLVAANQHPLVPLPGCGGAGLDQVRLVGALGLILICCAPLVGWIHGRRHREAQ